MSDVRSEDEAYFTEARGLLEEPYLSAEDVRAGSGFRGDDARWERARRPIVEAIHRDGSFLDVGCANGLLMESVVRWASEDGFAIEPHGLDLIPSVAELARERLPRYADRIHTGNVMEWKPPAASTSSTQTSNTRHRSDAAIWSRGFSETSPFPEAA